jgi:hypothetical protein
MLKRRTRDLAQREADLGSRSNVLAGRETDLDAKGEALTK